MLYDAITGKCLGMFSNEGVLESQVHPKFTCLSSTKVLAVPVQKYKYCEGVLESQVNPQFTRFRSTKLVQKYKY